jgi:hypothetical protein
MRNLTLILLLCFGVSYGVEKASKPFIFTPTTKAISSQVNANFDSIYVPFNKAIDTINRMKDTITTIDTLYSKKGKFDTLNVDSLKSRTTKLDYATITNLTTSGGTINGAIIGGSSPQAGTFTTLTSTGTESIDSGYSTKGIYSGGRFYTPNGYRIASGTSYGYGIYADATNFGVYDVLNNTYPFKIYPNSSSDLFVGKGNYVGMGTNSPNSYFAGPLVLKTTGTSCGLTIASDANQVGYLLFAKGTAGTDTYNGFMGYDQGSKTMVFATNHAEKMRIDSIGKVGIGTTIPDSTLTITGSLNVSGNAKFSGTVTVDSSVSTKGYNGNLRGNVTGNSSTSTRADSSNVAGRINGNVKTDSITTLTNDINILSSKTLQLKSSGGYPVDIVGQSTGINLKSGASTTIATFWADGITFYQGFGATTGNFSGTVNVDSVNSTKGIKAALFNGPLTGTADSAKGVVGQGVVDSSLTTTIVGWSSTTASSVYVIKIGVVKIISFYISGQSNSSAVSFSFTSATNGPAYAPLAKASDSSGEKTGFCDFNGYYINCYPTTGLWATTGTKTVSGQIVVY